LLSTPRILFSHFLETLYYSQSPYLTIEKWPSKRFNCIGYRLFVHFLRYLYGVTTRVRRVCCKRTGGDSDAPSSFCAEETRTCLLSISGSTEPFSTVVYRRYDASSACGIVKVA